MTRYFQNNNGTVFRAGHVRSTVPDARFEARPDEYTEVQVVPLDAIVIRREELPEVKPGESEESLRADVGGTEGDGTWIWPDSWRDPAAESWAHALEYLALAVHLRENPPVDEAQVKALAELLDSDPGEDALESGDTDALARFLVDYRDEILRALDVEGVAR